jgi:hypothetical protein
LIGDGTKGAGDLGQAGGLMGHCLSSGSARGSEEVITSSLEGSSMLPMRQLFLSGEQLQFLSWVIALCGVDLFCRLAIALG